MDTNLSRYLKNWAAQSQPPKDGRERLLDAAMFAPQESGQSFFMDVLKSFFMFPRGTQHAYEDGLISTFSHSRTWSFHIAYTFRLAA